VPLKVRDKSITAKWLIHHTMAQAGGLRPCYLHFG
jgi:hypothetical protein